MLVMGIVALFAETTPIKNGRDTVGTLSWSYSIQTYETREGSFTKITATNNSDQSVSAAFKTDAGGYESLYIPAHETREVTIDTNKAATRAFCLSATVR